MTTTFPARNPLEGGYSEYAALQEEKIRHGGFSQPSKEEEAVAFMTAVSGLAADDSAAALWKESDVWVVSSGRLSRGHPRGSYL